MIEELNSGLRKTYLVFHHNDKITKKGRFNKRDNSWVITSFQAEYLKLYLENGLEAALKYYKDIKRQIILQTFPVEKLAITRLVKSNEKTMPSLGFPTGERHTFHYYKAGVKGKKVIKPDYQPTKTEPYSVEYYLDQLQKLFDELPESVKIKALK
jgi:DNA polymerase elongation subunit (family B)